MSSYIFKEVDSLGIYQVELDMMQIYSNIQRDRNKYSLRLTFHSDWHSLVTRKSGSDNGVDVGWSFSIPKRKEESHGNSVDAIMAQAQPFI